MGMCFDTMYALLIAQMGPIACIKWKYVGEKLRKVRVGLEGAPIALIFPAKFTKPPKL